MSGRGALVVVGTPIGNLGDLSHRAVEAMERADAVACEDTRRTGRLLELAGISRKPPLLVLNDHTEVARIADVVERISRGERVVVVSDAGMPGISDPGERLVRAVRAEGFAVEVVPGPSALLTALVVSGLPTGRFVFEGFLPRKGSGRAARIEELVSEQRTAVLFEAPHRLERTLTELAAACGSERGVVVCRELTKLHEEVWTGTLGEGVVWAAAGGARGELVVVLAGAEPRGEPSDDELTAALAEELAAGRSRRDASSAVANRLGVPRRRAYSLVLGL